jgi:5-methylcytosine-specific restriction endonuclease McrA
VEQVIKRKAWNSGKKLDKAKYPKMGHYNKHTDSTKDKMKKNHKGMSGLKCSEDTKSKISLSQKGKPKLQERGENHWNWRGGISNESKRIRRQIEYKIWRELVFERDDWTCQKCLLRGVELNPHHIINFSEDIEKRFDIDNGVTLCRSCHYEFHKLYGYTNNNKEQVAFYFTKSVPSAKSE